MRWMLFICRNQYPQMKKFAFLLALPLIVFAGCLKSDNTCNYEDSSVVAPEEEQQALLDSLNAHGISATLHPSGFYYQILTPGTGASVSNLCSNITANYWGGFFNGNKFDSSATPISFTLGRLILAWQEAIPLVNEGGVINVYVPPTLGYGTREVRNNDGDLIIPANSYLVFHIEVEAIE